MKVYSHFIDSTFTKNPPMNHHSYSCHGFLCNAIPVSISMLTNNIDEILKAIIERKFLQKQSERATHVTENRVLVGRLRSSKE